MTQTSLQAVNATKTEQAVEIVAKLEEVHALIHSQPELWFGGVAPKLDQVAAMMTFYANEIRTLFNLPQPVVETPPGPTA